MPNLETETNVFKKCGNIFFCIGAQKAGTTTLHDIFQSHKQVCLPRDKEAHFFDLDSEYFKGLDWYWDKYYSHFENESIAGSFTPEYSYIRSVPKRIKQNLGKNVKFVFVLRNPVDRALSHYNMSFARGYEEGSFGDAILQEQNKINIGEFESIHFSYITRGLYLEQIKRYLKYFDAKNILFLLFESDIKKDVNVAVRKICKFLDIDSFEAAVDRHSNKAFTYKNDVLTRYLLNRNRKRNFVKSLFPDNIKNRMRKWYLNNRLKENKSKFDLTFEEKKTVYQDYYALQHDELQTLTGLDLSVWFDV